MTLYELARRVKKGVQLLDRKIPNWRQTIRKHADQFNFAEGDCCVLGTLEHYNGRMKVLKKRRANASHTGYGAALAALRVEKIDAQYGFDGEQGADVPYEDQVQQLSALWTAEIGIDLR